jgi:hypothetical protein
MTSTKVKSYTKKDGTKVRGYAVWTKGRRTPLLVDGKLSRTEAVKRALSNQKRGSTEVDKIRRLTNAEQKQADKGTWVRSGRNGEKPGYIGLRGNGPPIGGYKKQDYSNFFSNLIIEFSSGIAEKTNPELWNQAKSQAKAKMGPNHSARLMQLATKIYKSKGGGYKGRKPGLKNKLKKWSDQKWQASDGGNSRRTTGTGKKVVKKYLPKAAWSNLDKKEVSALNRSKSKAEKAGKQFSKAPKKLITKISKYWK